MHFLASSGDSYVRTVVLTMALAFVPASMAGNDASGQDVAKKSDSVVKTTADATALDAEGKQVITVKMFIEPGWHTYANPVGQEELASVQTTVAVDSKMKLSDVKVEYPAGKEIEDKAIGKYRVYEEKVEIKATVKRKTVDKGPLEVTVKFQSCTETLCLLPATVKLKVPE